LLRRTAAGQQLTALARWGGIQVAVALVAVGVLLHLPDFYMSRDMGFRMVGMGFSPLMWTGMTLIGLGLLVGLGSVLAAPPPDATRPQVEIRVTAIDDRPLRRRDIALLAVLGFGLVIDIMKPATLGFVLPGARSEYGLTLWQVALWPLVALIGTTIGSFVWGAVADRIGRRTSVLLAALLFVATSVCGAMPLYLLNLGMCLLMGMSAGGMLPIVFALLAEVVPRVHRGWLLVTLGCLTAAGGYLAASSAAALLEPHFGWRVLWLLGLPTGVLLIAFSRYIPESPRFLVRARRLEEAVRQLELVGVRVELVEAGTAPATSAKPLAPSIFGGGRLALTGAIGALGLSWGLVNFGLLTWLPTLFRHTGGSGSRLLASAALVSVPGSLLAPVLYSRWRTRASMTVFAGAIAAALVAIALLAGAGSSVWVVGATVVMLLSALAGTNAMLQIYSAEVFPTHVRGSGAGYSAGATKMGGIIGPQLVALILSLGFDVRAAAWVLAAPISLAAVAMVLTGKETGGRPLDEISAVTSEPAR
jgi:MFS transporter, putative metabolite:H+ symporter